MSLRFIIRSRQIRQSSTSNLNLENRFLLNKRNLRKILHITFQINLIPYLILRKLDFIPLIHRVKYLQNQKLIKIDNIIINKLTSLLRNSQSITKIIHNFNRIDLVIYELIDALDEIVIVYDQLKILGFV